MALLVACAGNTDGFIAALRREAPHLDVRSHQAPGRVDDITAALVWKHPHGLLARFPRLQLVISAGAGVDHVLGDADLPRSVPLVRFVDPDLTARMTEWVVLQVLFQARRGPEFRIAQAQKTWRDLETGAAREIRVGVMGTGVLGAAALQGLAPFGYQLSSWSRSGGAPAPSVTRYGGAGERDAFLARTDILVVLLPLTEDTRGLIDADLLARLSTDGRRSPGLPGPILINAGRGRLQREADILAALDSGRLHAASLDVFEVEPLPATSPLWSHPRVTITPHVAADTSPHAIAAYSVRQIERLAQGSPLEHLVHFDRGY